ncbi:MAG: AMP-binding protein, partial [Gammaproteobacteria bacterium]|nr:AMP-binding protein [Gammaproteobacteria bacterium]
MNLFSLFKRQVDLRPDAAALIDVGSNRRWTFAEIERASRDMAARLTETGLERGDGVLLFLPMSVRLYVTLLACFRLGLVAIVIDPYAGRAHVERCCRRYPPRAMIGTPKAQLLR